MWGALSDERTGLSFTIAAGPRQRSHFQVRVPWDSWPYFTVSVSRLTFSSPPTTRRATVEVFDPASTRDDNTYQIHYSCLITWEQANSEGDNRKICNKNRDKARTCMELG
jgi:hypothetical protein